MKKRMFVLAGLLCICFIGICQEKDRLVKPLNTIDESRFEFELVKEFYFDINDVGNTKISLFTIPNWTDPGDILKIKISNKDYDTIYTNLDGWVKFDQNYPVSKSIKEKNKLDTDLVFLFSDNECNYLVLFGWVYESKHGLCTVIDMATGELVFNQNALITDFDGGKMTIIFKDTVSCTGSVNLM